MTGPNGRESPGAPALPEPEPYRAGTLERRLEEFFAGLSLAVMLTGDQHCANVIAAGAHRLAGAWAGLAKQNPAVKRAIEAMLSGGAWGEVVFASAAVVIPIAQHHQLYPADWPLPFSFGIVPESPEVARERERPSTPTARPDDASSDEQHQDPPPEAPPPGGGFGPGPDSSVG